MGRAEDFREFYEGYWDWRIRTDYLYGQGPPPRVAIVAEILGRTEGPLRVLDIGCGEGSLGRILRGQGRDDLSVTGCDISSKALELARPHYDTVHSFDLERDDPSPLRQEGPFDAVVCMEVLEHLFQPDKALAKIRSLLRPGGAGFFSFPNFVHYRDRLLLLQGRFPEESQHLYSKQDHLHYYTVDSFRDLLEEAGFEVRDMVGILEFPRGFGRAPSRLRRWLGRRFLGFFARQVVVVAGEAGGST